MVGATGFEPATSCSRSRRATGLRYAPPALLVNEPSDAPGESRTPNLLIRSQMLYPIELRAPNDPMTYRPLHPVSGIHGQTHKLFLNDAKINCVNTIRTHPAKKAGEP